MAKLNFKKNNNNSVTIPSIFIEKYLPKANGTFVKVYLYALMYSSIPNANITIKDIAKALDIIESDVYKAWKYWEECNIVKINKIDNEEFDIELLDFETDNKTSTNFNAKKYQESKPNYTPKELDIYINKNTEIKYLFKVARDKFGIIKNSNDSSILYSFYDWLRLPIEVIIMLLEYCSSNSKYNMRYIEKVAIDWADKGIDSTVRAEDYLKKLEQKNKHLSTIKNSLGIVDRVFTSPELKYIDKWVHEYKFDIEIIKLACELTIFNTSRPTIKYTHSILEDWNNKKIKTIKQAKEEINNFKKTNKEKYSNSKKQTKTSNNKFNNFKQEKYDFDEIEKIMQEKRKKV